MVWESDTENPVFGFPGVIPNRAALRPDFDPEMKGYQHKVYYDFTRPYHAKNARNPRGGRNFRRISNAGSYDVGEYAGIFEGFNDLDLFDFSEHLLGGTAPSRTGISTPLTPPWNRPFLRTKWVLSWLSPSSISNAPISMDFPVAPWG
jgi:hypothetical protein